MQSKLQGGSVIVCGYVPKDAELKTVGEKGSSLCRWSVKVDEKANGDQKEAVWANCQAWHGTARYAASIKKGDTVLCVGNLETNTGTDGKVYKNLVCEFVSVMKSVPKASPVAPLPETSEITDLSEYEEILGDGESPF